MVDQSLRDDVVVAAPPASLTRRRLLFCALVGATMAGLIWLLAVALSAGGFGAVDLVLLILFTVTLPWSVIGFWNATIGLLIMRFARDPVACVTPAAARVRGNEPITASTALLVCIRNEPPERIISHLVPLLEGLASAGVGQWFPIYVLSDTDVPTIAAAEEADVAVVAKRFHERIAIKYRRREQNPGFKAGNIRDFCERWGMQHDFAIVLDADSLMTAQGVIRLVRIMQADPHLGILQNS